MIDNNNGRFAIRVEDFEAAVTKLIQFGFREDAADDDPVRLLTNRNSAAGYQHAYSFSRGTISDERPRRAVMLGRSPNNDW